MLEKCSTFLPQKMEFHSQAAGISRSALMKPHPELRNCLINKSNTVLKLMSHPIPWHEKAGWHTVKRETLTFPQPATHLKS